MILETPFNLLQVKQPMISMLCFDNTIFITTQTYLSLIIFVLYVIFDYRHPGTLLDRKALDLDDRYHSMIHNFYMFVFVSVYYY